MLLKLLTLWQHTRHYHMKHKRTHTSWLAYLSIALVAPMSIPDAIAAGSFDAHSIAAVMQPPSYDDQTTFFRLVDEGNVARIKSHLYFVQSFLATTADKQDQINLEFTNQAGNTPLLRAAMQPNVDMVNYLLDNGANINAINAKYESALIIAYNTGHFAVAKQLLARGAEDPYHAAQLIEQYEAQHRTVAEQQVIEEDEVDNLNRNLLFAGGGAVVIGGVVLSAAQGDSKSSGGGGSSSAPSNDCGASSGIHPEVCTNTTFQTSEAAAQEGVLTMKADYAIAHGYDGRIFNRSSGGALVDDVSDGRVLVAVIDSGVDLVHSDLDANLRTDLAVTCTTGAGCVAGGQDTDGHGTNVAGIIAAERNGVGMHGIAPEARVIPIAAIISGGSTTAALKYANNQGAQAINNSWGYVYDSFTDLSTIPIIDATGPVIAAHPSGSYSAPSAAALRSSLVTVEDSTTDLVQFQAAVAAHRLIVFSAGNSGLTQPGILAGLPLYFQGATTPGILSQVNYDIVNPEHYDWSRNWVSSISLDDNNTISSFSHQCGVSKNWCLAAPGQVASTTKLGGGYEANSGTSFSAPNVTGAIAVMLGAFPQLTPEAVLQILFDTATDLGATGVDDVYGRGLVNLQKATDPTTGGWTLSVSSFGRGSESSSSSSSFSFEDSGFGLSTAFGSALAQNNVNVMFQDGYNKDYSVPLSVVAGSVTHKQTSFDRFNLFAEESFDNVVRVNNNTALGFSAAAPDPIPDKTGSTPFGKFSAQSTVPMGLDNALVALNYRTNMAEAMQPLGTKNLTATNALQNPYLHLVNSATSSVMGYQTGAAKLRVAAYSGTMNGDRPDYNYRFDNDKKASGVVSEIAFANNDNTANVAIENGVTMEDNSFLGSEASGAFGIDKSSTYFTGFSGRITVADDVSLIGNANVGLTNVAASNSSIFTNFGSVMTGAFALGAEFKNIAGGNNALGFMVSQPLHVMRGNANLTLPTDVATDGSVIFQNQRLNLAPSAREIDFESYYHLASGNASDLSVNVLFRINPDNDNTAPNDFTLLTKYKLGF